MELISVIKKEAIDLKKLNTSNALEREQIACSLDEEMIHFHVIDQILNMKTDMSNKRKLILASVPDEVIIKRLNIINEVNQSGIIMAGLLEEIINSLSN